MDNAAYVSKMFWAQKLWNNAIYSRNCDKNIQFKCDCKIWQRIKETPHFNTQNTHDILGNTCILIENSAYI